MQKLLRRLLPSLLLAFFGVLTTQLGYETVKRGYIEYIPQSGPSRTFSPAHDPAAFWALSWGMCILGLLLLVSAVFVFIRFARLASLIEKLRPSETTSGQMKYVWRTINIASIALSLWAGYSQMTPERLRGTNPDQYLCLAVLIIMPLFVLACFSRRDSLRRPSLDRFPLNWTGDPLQALFVTTLGTFTWAIGCSLRISDSGSLGYWTVATWWSIFAGLLLGQIIGYAIFRRRIRTSN